jgi:hypothetical protein
MTNAVRRYSPKTIKLLFGRSGNQCAFPDCANPIIAPETEQSDAAVVGYICHIYAAADDGPRGKTGLTEKERNAPENLILMCGHHHPIVDKQFRDYPADKLKAWKTAHEAQFQRGTAEAEKRQAAIQQAAFLQGLSDREIQQEVDRLRKARQLVGFPIKEAALALARRVDNTELAAGSSIVRAVALAWCARFLSLGDTIDRARESLERSKALGACEEARIAEAFILSAVDKDRALAMLAPINTPAARSAAFRIVTNHDKAEGALEWALRCELKIEDFDADGKFVLIMSELSVGRWQDAFKHATKITEEDFRECPVLHHAVAMAHLVQAVPEDFRSFVLINVPFDASHFPLASDAESLSARRQATISFLKASEIAQTFGAATAANPEADYALWLQLRDPRDGSDALEILRSSMRDAVLSLRRVHFALQFGIKLDIASIEKEIDRRVALSGKGTGDEALARFSLAFTRGSPKAVADYIAKHRTQLYEHLHKPAIQTIEIELLARAGLTGAANEKLATALADGLGRREEQHLRRIMSESEGADPALERRKSFEKTDDLRDLANLVDLLEEQKAWVELCGYAETLFARTRALEDGFRVAKALNESEQYTRLFEFLSRNGELTSQSIGLKTMWAWSLYREGRFDDAAVALKELTNARNDENDRALRANLAIASGNWDELVEFTTDEWSQREKRTAVELLTAGQLAQAVKAPHAKDLVTAASAKAPDDAGVLASAYFHAVGAGWQQNAKTSQWLARAAELSGKDGPLRSISMQELISQKPQWDKQVTETCLQLNEGKLPMFGAARLLNRSFIDFVLLQSLASLTESDVRARSIVYAYSGARPIVPLSTIKRVALDLSALFTLERLGLLGKAVETYEAIVIPHSTAAWLFQERQQVTFHQPSRIRDAHEIKRLIAMGALRVMQAPSSRDHGLVREVGDELSSFLIAAKSKTESGDGIPRVVVRSAPVHRVGSLMEEEADLGPYSDYLCSCQAVIAKLRSKGLLTLTEEQQARSYLRLHERSWPSELAIPDGAELYLDNLSVTYLQTIAVLGKLKTAGLTAYISDGEDADANRLISFENLSVQQLDIIEGIRRSLSDGIKSKRIRALRSSETEPAFKVRLHPTFDVLGIDQPVDALVVDDRFINRHMQIDAHGRRTPILTTLDLLDDLTSRGIVPRENLFGHRTYLRQAGFQLIPLTADELSYHLENAPLASGVLVETAELKAVREAMLKARMSKMLQIPEEVPWLHHSMNAIIRSLKHCWETRTDPKEAAAYSEWLIELLDVRGWTASTAPGNERGFALYAYAAHVLHIMSPPNEVSTEVREIYYDWVDKRLVKNIQEAEPEVFQWIVDRAREMIEHSTETAVAELGA